VRAGRGSAAFRAALLFVVVFAVSVQYFLFRWPGWMYAYLIPEDAVSLAWVSPVFFISVVAAGLVGASVSLQLIRAGKMSWAVANALLGLGAWALIWMVTWDPYFQVGTYQSYHAGLAPPLNEVPSFQSAMNVVGLIQVLVGVGAVVWLLRAGSRAAQASRIRPDLSATEWRREREPPQPAATAAANPVIEGGFIGGIRPIDGAPLEPVPITPLADIHAMAQRARAAQQSWSMRPLDERAELLRLAGRRLLRRAEEAARILEAENGRPVAESLLSEVIPSADLFSYWTTSGRNLLQGDEVPIDPITFPGKRGVIERLPRGVVAAISPWNFPLMLPLRTIVPALLAGNAVILKPSEHSARCGAFLAKLFEDLLPRDVFTLIQGGGDAAQGLIAAGMDAVVFIGSPRTGRIVAKACADQLTPVTLELGGKDAAIVLADADLERTANGIVWAAFANAGQNCAAIERCYVVKALADPLIESMRVRIAALRMGPGPEGQVDIGPLTTPSQKAVVEAQLAEARERGLLAEASRPKGGGLFVTPTLVVDPPDDLALVCEETFGPVLPIFRVKDEEEAIRRTNASPYGLTVSIWSKDTDRAERLGRRIHAGVITINNHAFTGGLAQAPWGGVRGSGFGVTNSPGMLDQLTHPRFVLVDRNKSKRELWWYPYDEGKLRLARGLIRLRAGGSGRAGALGDVVRGFLGGTR